MPSVATRWIAEQNGIHDPYIKIPLGSDGDFCMLAFMGLESHASYVLFF